MLLTTENSPNTTRIPTSLRILIAAMVSYSSLVSAYELFKIYLTIVNQ
jgi:hypothetical protein